MYACNDNVNVTYSYVQHVFGVLVARQSSCISKFHIKSVLYIDMRYKMRDNCYLRLFERTITFVIQEGVPGKENATVLLYCRLS